ncbi:unnamed protein product [Prunus armeniaca]
MKTPSNSTDKSIGYKLPFRQNRGKPPNRYSPDISKTSEYPIVNHVSTEKLYEPLKVFVHQLSAIHIPTKVTEALKDPKWVQAIKEEMKALEKNQTWTLKNLSRGKKTNAYGSIERYKARLVAKGYTQTYGVDYEKTFAPVVKLNTVRVLLSLAVNLDWSLHQFDVKMKNPWRRCIWTFLMDIILLRMEQYKGKVAVLIIYVDDMIITGNDKHEISQLQDYLATEFENHHLGEYPDQVPTNKERYKRLVGRLIYLSHTRPDIPYAVSVISQFMHSPSEGHMNAGSITDRKSTFGYFTFVRGNLVTWRSKKQKVVALSSEEAEFKGMTKGICELIWLKRLLTELGYRPTSIMNIFCDNNAAIAIA